MPHNMLRQKTQDLVHSIVSAFDSVAEVNDSTKQFFRIVEKSLVRANSESQVSTLGTYCIALEVQQGLTKSDLDGSAVSFNFAHEHSPLYCGDAESSQVLLVSVLQKSPLGFLTNEERR